MQKREISRELHGRLSAYTAGAEATGHLERRKAKILAGALLTAGAACASQPAAVAAIHYTPMTLTIGSTGAAPYDRCNFTAGTVRRCYIRYWQYFSVIGIFHNASLSADAQALKGPAGARYLASGAAIGAAQATWTGALQVLCEGAGTPGGSFLGKDGYIGIRFNAAPNRNYGWIRFQGSADGHNGTIKGWAWQDTVNATIFAGEGQ